MGAARLRGLRNGYANVGGERPERSRPGRRERSRGAVETTAGTHWVAERTTGAPGQRATVPPYMQATQPCAAEGAEGLATSSTPESRPAALAGSGWRPNDAATERHSAAPSAIRASRECFVRRSIMFGKPGKGILFPLGRAGGPTA